MSAWTVRSVLTAITPTGSRISHPIDEQTLLVVVARLAPLVPPGSTWFVEPPPGHYGTGSATS